MGSPWTPWRRTCFPLLWASCMPLCPWNTKHLLIHVSTTNSTISSSASQNPYHPTVLGLKQDLTHARQAFYLWILFCLPFLRQFHVSKTTLNSPCSWRWPWISDRSAHILPTAKITDLSHHHAWLWKLALYSSLVFFQCCPFSYSPKTRMSILNILVLTPILSMCSSLCVNIMVWRRMATTGSYNWMLLPN